MNILRILLLVWAALLLPLDGLHAAVVVDRAGRRIEVGMPFCRIISLYGAHTENLFALGLDEEIIGVGRNENYPPEALKKTRSYERREGKECRSRWWADH